MMELFGSPLNFFVPPPLTFILFRCFRGGFLQHVRNMFNFSASEKILKEFKGRYTYFESEEKKVPSK